MDFFDALVRYETDLWNHLDARLLESGGVSLAVLDALRVIARHPGEARVAELQEGLRITVGAASKLVDRLERGGLARRRPHPADRRSSLLELTEAGRRAHDSGVVNLRAEMGRHLDGASGDLHTVTSILRDLSDRLTTVPAR